MRISLDILEPCTVSDQKNEQMNKMVFTHQYVLDFERLFYSTATAVYFD